MSKINFNLTVDIDECATAIKTVGDTLTPIIISEPGVGKSTLLKILSEKNGDSWRTVGDSFDTDEYDYIYVDCPVKDMMDVAASIPNHTTKTLEYYVSSLFRMDSPKKKIIMLDEFLKAPKLMQIIFTRLILERTVGDAPLPKGSIVFATSNNSTDGVGDGMLAHVGNRVCTLQMSKPTADKWNLWASLNKIARPIRAWVAMNPRALHSYLDGGQEDNPYIFKPSNTNKQFVSPRSLAKASPIVENKDALGENLMMAMLSGTIGEAAARSMSAFIALEGSYPSFKDVLSNPEKAKLPDDVSAQIMMMFEAVDYLETQDDLNNYMTYVGRIPSTEVQSVFYTMILRGKPRLARYNESIKNWARDNHMLM
jgi:hypothetical protein